MVVKENVLKEINRITGCTREEALEVLSVVISDAISNE